MEPFRFSSGSTPLLVSMPHVGTGLPDSLARRMTEAGRALPDTDWHVDRLYDFSAAAGAGVIRAVTSRYVIDLNRPPDGGALYPGASNTELCPLTTFDDAPIWRPGEGPDAAEVEERRERYWRPYHRALAAELSRLRERHGIAMLFDAHSIRSRVSRFFDGRLPDLNLGTGGGITAAGPLIARLMGVIQEQQEYGSVLDGHFKGGYITRAYGRPAERTHAVQLELAQATYMDEDPPYGFRDDLAGRLRPLLRRLIETMRDWRPEG